MSKLTVVANMSPRDCRINRQKEHRNVMREFERMVEPAVKIGFEAIMNKYNA